MEEHLGFLFDFDRRTLNPGGRSVRDGHMKCHKARKVLLELNHLFGLRLSVLHSIRVTRRLLLRLLSFNFEACDSRNELANTEDNPGKINKMKKLQKGKEGEKEGKRRTRRERARRD